MYICSSRFVETALHTESVSVFSFDESGQFKVNDGETETFALAIMCFGIMIAESVSYIPYSIHGCPELIEE